MRHRQHTKTTLRVGVLLSALAMIVPAVAGGSPVELPDLGLPEDLDRSGGIGPTFYHVLPPAPVEYLDAPAAGELGVQTSCSFSGATGQNGLELVTPHEPYGSSGWTDSTDGNNIYIIFHLCRTTFKDTGGNRYAFLVYKETQNAASNSHVSTWWDYYNYDPTERTQWTPSSTQSIVDIDPVNEKETNGGSLSFSLGYAGASLGWSQDFSEVKLVKEYWSGQKVRWRTEQHWFGYHGPSSFTSTYGAVQKAASGEWAQHNWWFEDRFHHYTGANHIHTFSSPCSSPGCGYNTFYTWMPS